ncbi:MAG: hypothetical protein ACYDGR_06660 [Candidatus Dormibacteria bacterium]
MTIDLRARASVDAETTICEPLPSPEELTAYMDAVDKVMGSEPTRTAWLMGFLAGSALVERPSVE